jgi:hydroxymethylpyrimidine pyrophosphatase-like HAD family hydrolase
MTATGLVQRNDLLVAASPALEDRSSLHRILQQAIDAAVKIIQTDADKAAALKSLSQKENIKSEDLQLLIRSF